MKKLLVLLMMLNSSVFAQYSMQAELKNTPPVGAIGEPHVITKRHTGVIVAVGEDKVPSQHGCLYFQRKDLLNFDYVPVTVRLGEREIQTCHIQKKNHPLASPPTVGQKFHVITKEFTWGGGPKYD